MGSRFEGLRDLRGWVVVQAEEATMELSVRVKGWGRVGA